MSTLIGRGIEDIVAIDAQIFVWLSELISVCLITTLVSHPVHFTWFQNTTLADDVFGIISEIVTGSTSLWLRWRSFLLAILIHGWRSVVNILIFLRLLHVRHLSVGRHYFDKLVLLVIRLFLLIWLGLLLILLRDVGATTLICLL